MSSHKHFTLPAQINPTILHSIKRSFVSCHLSCTGSWYNIHSLFTFPSQLVLYVICSTTECFNIRETRNPILVLTWVLPVGCSPERVFVLRLLFLARVLRFYKHVRHNSCHLYQQAMHITKLVCFTLRANEDTRGYAYGDRFFFFCHFM